MLNYNCCQTSSIKLKQGKLLGHNFLASFIRCNCFKWFFRVVRNTRNPVYDEDFTFYGLSLAELSAMSLHFVVLSFDRYSRDDIIGEVICPLNAIDLIQIETQQIALSKEIQPRSIKVNFKVSHKRIPRDFCSGVCFHSINIDQIFCIH